MSRYKTRRRQRYYDIPKDDFIPLLVLTRTVLDTPDEEVPIEVMDDVIKRVKHFKPQLGYVN